MAKLHITNDTKKLFIVAFREVFAHDADLTYNKTDAALGKIIISSKYANPSTENKLPQIIVNTVAYNMSNTTLYNNFKEEKDGNYISGKQALRVYSNLVPFQLSIDCVSDVKAECELVADKLFNSLTMEDALLYSALNMNVRGVAVGEAIPRNQYPQYQFVTPVNVQGDFMIQWTMGPPSQHPLLADIQLELDTIEI